MGDKFALPNLEHMLALISLLARSEIVAGPLLGRVPYLDSSNASTCPLQPCGSDSVITS